MPYEGISVDLSQPAESYAEELSNEQVYTVKIDQAEKGRFKKGLVKLNRTPQEVGSDLREFKGLGYAYALIEPFVPHDQSDERYISAELTRGGLRFSVASHGGIDIESNATEVAQFLSGTEIPDVVRYLPSEIIEKLSAMTARNHISFIEINPLLIRESKPIFLDAAIEVDDEAEFFAPDWTAVDVRHPKGGKATAEENAVLELNDKSQASFMLEVLNPNGSVFVLLSGGGASVTVADEVSNLGFGGELGNYGEYSGNPNSEETALYTEQVLSLLLASKAKRKVLVIAGAVANFTDVQATFRGVITALELHKNGLQTQNIGIYARRGGPREQEGLEMMRNYLSALELQHEVFGPELPLPRIISKAIEWTRQ